MSDFERPESEFEEAYDDWRELKGGILATSLGKVPRRPTLLVPVNATVGEAIRAMNDRHVGCAVIVQDGRLVGIFTERDVLRKVAGKALDVNRTPVAEVMTSEPDVLPAETTIAFALRKMHEEGYRHIPLVDGDHHPVGVVAVRDIVGWLCEMFPASVLNLPPEPGFPREIDGA